MGKADATSEPAGSEVRKFNPGTHQSDREIVDQFVVRRHELDIVLEVLRGNMESASCQHILVVAPRGRGKTMLLARAEAELRTNEELSAHLLPVRFMEENHEIATVADFWLETLFHLARISASAHPQLAAELRATHASLCERWFERALHEHARAAVLDAADRLDRKLVLMVESLQALSHNVDDDFGWQLRAVLQSEPQIMLVGSALSRFQALDDAEQPFFELFRIVELKPLASHECRRLWEAVSGDSASGREIRPLEILTGGSPRLLVIVAGLARHRSLRQLMEELVVLIDEHTEYFRGHLEVLPNSERRVYVALLDLWRPSGTGEIAARARMDIRKVSTMLGRLVDRGAVVPEPSGSGKRRRYTVTEPLYSIYYKLRRERDEAAVVENLVLFMVAFYDPFVLYRVFDPLWSESQDEPSLHSGIERALARRPPDVDMGSRMVWDRLQEASDKIANHRHAEAQLRFQKEVEAAFRNRAFARVIELVDRYVADGWDRLAPNMREHETAYVARVKADAHLELGDFRKVIAIGAEIIDRFRATRDAFVLYRCAGVIFRKVAAHFRLNDFEGTVASARELVEWFGDYDDPDFQLFVAEALILQAAAERKLRRFGASASLLDGVVTRFHDSDAPWLRKAVVGALLAKGGILRLQHNHRETAISAYDEAIEHARGLNMDDVGDDLASAFLNRGFCQASLSDFKGEIASYQELIDTFGHNAGHRETVMLTAGFLSLRQAEMGSTEDALRGCEELETNLGHLSGVWRTWIEWLALSARAMALMVRRDAAAVDAFRSAYAEFPSASEVATPTMIRLVLNMIALGGSESDLVEVLSSDSSRARTLAPLIAALRERCGEAVRAPAEVLKVAADIRRRIEEKAVKGVLTAF